MQGVDNGSGRGRAPGNEEDGHWQPSSKVSRVLSAQLVGHREANHGDENPDLHNNNYAFGACFTAARTCCCQVLALG
jgi:hypothetical protein